MISSKCTFLQCGVCVFAAGFAEYKDGSCCFFNSFFIFLFLQRDDQEGVSEEACFCPVSVVAVAG